MTERGSGSDVSGGTRTIAKLQPDGSYRLFGVKWFCSATTTDVAYTTARVEDPDGSFQKGLSCFLLRIRDENTGKLHGMKVIRLKKKMGTRQLPTCEMELDGAVAHIVSRPGRGIAAIAKVVNVSRIYNSIHACSYMQRFVLLAHDFAKRRKVFGFHLAESPLHMGTVESMETTYRASVCMTFQVAEFLGRVEAGETGTAATMLRILTPLVKIFTAKNAVTVASEGLESFGAYGYM